MKIFGMKRGFKFSPDGTESGSTETTPQTKEPAKEDTTKKTDNSVLLKEIENLRKQNSTYKEAESARREKQAKENGEFEKLYLQLKEEKESLSKQIKKEKINNLVAVKTMRLGLKNEAFLKMFDSSDLELDDSGDIPNLDVKINEFKEKFPELFSDSGSISEESHKKPQELEKKVPKVHNDRLRVAQGLDSNEVDELTKIIRDPNTSRRIREKAIAKRYSLKSKLK